MYYQGIYSPDIVNQLTGVYLSHPAPQYFLCGRIVNPLVSAPEFEIWDEGNRLYEAAITLEQGSYFCRFDTRGRFAVSGKVFDTRSRLVYQEEFEKIKKVHSWYVPQIVRYTEPQARRRLTVSYRSCRINERIDPSYFTLKVPDTAQRVPLDTVHE